MVTCPLCEHAQAGGEECEVCGRRLAGPAPGVEPALEPLPGLEGSGPVATGPVAAELLSELEPTLRAALPAPLVEIVPDLEGQPAPAVVGPVERMAGIEGGLEGLPADEATPFPAVVECRYCKQEGALGERFCAGCGMLLPTADRVAGAREAPPDEDLLRCRCGAQTRGPRCFACGAAVE